MSLVCLSPAHAVQPDEIMADPAKESRARDLRLLVRERIAAGDSDAQVMDFLVARYGEFVLLKPRFESHTWLLWLLPPFALAGGLVLLVFMRRRRQTSLAAGGMALTAAEEARLTELLNDEKP